MTLNDAIQIMTVMLQDNDRSGLSLLPDEKDALNTALDYMNEGPPGRVVHELKLGWNFCDAVYSGRKTFELRKNDRGFQTGDRIRFTPIRFETNDAVDRYPPHPIQEKLYEITYILNGWGLTQDCVALAIREVTDV